MSIYEDYELDPATPLDDLHHTLYAENTRLRDSLWDLAARRAEFDAALAQLASVKLAAEVAFREPNHSNASYLRTAASNARSMRYPVGGSNVSETVARVLEAVAALLDADPAVPPAENVKPAPIVTNYSTAQATGATLPDYCLEPYRFDSDGWTQCWLPKGHDGPHTAFAASSPSTEATNG